MEAARLIDREQWHIDREANPRQLETKEKIEMVWKLYIPTALAGSASIAAIIAGAKSSGRRTAAAVAAYSLTEKAFTEYKEKVVEQIGANKEQKIHDEIVKDHIEKNPPTSKEVLILGKDQVLCCELLTHRYFKSDMESLRRAQNDLNSTLISQTYAPLNEFYDILDLPYTSMSSNVGWESDKLMELRFTTIMSEDGTPCLAFEYNYTKPIR